MNLFDNPWPVLTLLVGSVSVVTATGFRSGPLIAPFSMSMIMLMAIFGVRPLFIESDPSHSFYSYDVTQGMYLSTVLGFVGVCGLSGGYFFRVLMTARTSHSAPTGNISPSPRGPRMSGRAVLIVAFGATILWGLLMAIRFGGTGVISLMAEGRSSDVSDVLAGLPVAVYALPAAAAFVAAYWRIVSEKTVPFRRREKMIFWVAMSVSIVPPAMLGNRRFIIPCLVGAAIATVSPHWNRTVKIRVVAAVFLGFTLLAAIPYIRSSGARSEGASFFEAISDFIQAEGISGVFTKFFTSYDTEMLDYIAFVVPRIGTDVPWGNGRGTILDILVSPIPSSIMPFPSWSNQVLIESFGASCADGICPVPSVVGTAYFDFGIAGVAVATALLGIGSRLFEERIFSTHGASLLAILILGSLPATAVRGNLPSQLWIGFNIFVVALVLVKVVSLLVVRRDGRLDRANAELLTRHR